MEVHMRAAWLFAAALGVGVLGVSIGVARAGDERAGADKAVREKWAEHMGDVPFIIGFEQGMKEAAFTGKPPMLFFTMEG